MKFLVCICLLIPVFINADCGNGIKDFNEADVDCGKECFALCDVGKMCFSDFDCETWKCSENKCIGDTQTVRFLAASGAAAATKKVVQQATLTGITKKQFVDNKAAIEKGIATSLGLKADAVSAKILEGSRRYLSSSLRVEITVLVADEVAASAMEKKLKPSTFQSTLVAKVASATGVPAKDITAKLSEPVVSDTTAPSPSTKAVVSASTMLSSTPLMVAVALVLNIILSQY